MFEERDLAAAEALLAACREQNLRLVTAESCTGGLIAALLTAIPGSSEVFERGFVTYSNAAKSELLGVRPETLASFGAVSEEVAREMARGALGAAPADLALAVTGIAGPGGGSAEKPVGLVWFGLARRGAVWAARCHFGGGREEVRRAAMRHGIELLQRACRPELPL